MSSLQGAVDTLVYNVNSDWNRIENEWISEVLPHDDDWFTDEHDFKGQWSIIDQWILETIFGEEWNWLLNNDNDWDIQNIQVGGTNDVNVDASTSREYDDDKGVSAEKRKNDGDVSKDSKKQKTDNFYVIEKVNEV